MVLPNSAKARWIALIPSLSFKLVAYETMSSFFLVVNGKVLKLKEGNCRNHINQNRLVKKAFKLANLSSDYAEQFDRTSSYEFVRNMLSNACFDKGITHKDCFIFETL